MSYVSSSSLETSSSSSSMESSSGFFRLEVAAAPLLVALSVLGPSSTTTNDFWRSLSFHLRVREMAWNQSVDCLSAQTVGKGYLDAVTLMWSPSALGCELMSKAVIGHIRFSSTRPRPSNDAQAVLRELYGTQIRSSMLSGSSMGRNDNVWGQIGVIKIAGISG